MVDKNRIELKIIILHLKLEWNINDIINFLSRYYFIINIIL